MIHPIILSGGAGTRLWPLSRESFPKQFLPLLSSDSMLQATLLRLRGLPDLSPPTVVCNEEHRFLVAEQLRAAQLRAEAIVLEPEGRNTAPAAAVAAILALNLDEDAILLVLPSDHAVDDVEAFQAAVLLGIKAAEEGKLVALGVRPDRAETGFGYIRQGEELPQAPGSYAALEFVEKPDRSTAEGFLSSGGYLWNSGMFLLPARLYLDELQRYQPQIAACAREAAKGAVADLDFLRLGSQAFLECPSLSIDYAVMELTQLAAVVPVDMAWSDVGSWQSLWQIQPKDQNGNVCKGEARLLDVENCFISSEHLVAGIGLRNLAIVATSDAILVADLDRSQDVKIVVDGLRADGKADSDFRRMAFRPWGSYELVDRGDRFKVKRITVNPGQKTSLQMHFHRAEHWVVVSGTAEVTCGDEVRIVAENQSIYIPLGASHRLHNPGRIPLHLIEVQSGSHCVEEDIVRADDVYGR